MAEVWVVDDDDSMRWVLARALERAGFAVTDFAAAETALARLARGQPDAILADIRMPGVDGLDLAAEVRQQAPGIPVVIMTAHSDLETTVAAFREGAFEYLAKPFDLDEAVAVVGRACRHEPMAAAGGTNAPAASPPHSPPLIGQAAAMQSIFRAIGRLARAPVPVLLCGESGSGKEVVARALHEHSPRYRGPFVALNMAAIPSELLESELFGHERGAFTGAEQRRIGRFEQAGGGTLFLDEIGDMPAGLQTRLLRVLSEGTFERVGGRDPLRADARILAATHQDLEHQVERGHFRADLFHRLNVVRLHIPPLRERSEDIPVLARHFLRQCAQELQLPNKELSAAAANVLARHDWPGNVRELENLCRWLIVMAPGHDIEPDDLPAGLTADAAVVPAQEGDWRQALSAWADARIAAGADGLGAEARNTLEAVLIERALAATGGHRQRAARLLGWGRNTLSRRIRELGLVPD